MKSTLIVDRRELERLVKRAGGRCSKSMSDAALAREAARCGLGTAKVIKPKKTNPRQSITVLDPGGISHTGPFGVFGSREWMRAPKAARSNPERATYGGYRHESDVAAWQGRVVYAVRGQEVEGPIPGLSVDRTGHYRWMWDSAWGWSLVPGHGRRKKATKKNPMGDYLNIDAGVGAEAPRGRWAGRRAKSEGFPTAFKESRVRSGRRQAKAAKLAAATAKAAAEATPKASNPSKAWSKGRKAGFAWGKREASEKSYESVRTRLMELQQSADTDFDRGLLRGYCEGVDEALYGGGRRSNPLGDYLNVTGPPVGRPWKPGRGRAEGFPTAFKEARARAGRQLQKAVKALDKASKGAKGADAKAPAAKKNNPGLAIIGNPPPTRRRNSPYEVGDRVQSLLTGAKGRVVDVAKEAVVRWDDGDLSSEKPNELVHCPARGGGCHTHERWENPHRGRRGHGRTIRPGDIV